MRIARFQTMRITSLLALVGMGFGLLAAEPLVPPSPPALPALPVTPIGASRAAVVAVPAAPNPFVWDAMTKDVTPAAGEANAVFTFWVTNTGPTEASILDASTTCGCTVAQLPSKPWVFKPGQSAPFSATMNLAGKFGLNQKLVHVVTSAGQQTLIVRANIPMSATSSTPGLSERESRQLMALGDRQKVFQGDCVKCHVEPTLGLTGEKLFITACGICHVSDHRAAMVPDLAAIKTATSADYWKTWITYGKPGSLMPAFAKEQGGILDQKQIDSLAEFLVKHYPSKGVLPTALPGRPGFPPPPVPPAVPQSK